MPTLSELFPETDPPRHQVVDLESDWFASLWLHEFRHHATRTEPVIAVVRELVTTLRDEQIPAPQAHRALRRAVSLLSTLAGTSRQVDRDGVHINDEVERSQHLDR
jgi:hypothetical protein